MERDSAKVVVVGGGIAGCSVLYHLATAGCNDAILLEKGELTEGTTWHSVGNTPAFSDNLHLLRLLKYSVELYDSLGAAIGQSTGFRKSGSLRLAMSREQLDWYRKVDAVALQAGLTSEVISRERVVEFNPLVSDHGVFGALHVADDGFADPAGLTFALAKGAQAAGGEVRRHTTVVGIQARPGGGFVVKTDRGLISAEYVVNATGMWASEIAQMLGMDLPIIALEHQYVVTESIPEISEIRDRLPVTRDPDGSFYVRPEGNGLLIGFYEENPVPWGVDGIPGGFDRQLLQPNIEQFSDNFSRAIARVPVLENAGIQNIINGPDAFTPDGRCLLGEVPGLPNFLVLTGFSSLGIAYSGGAGRSVAEWIMHGAPSENVWALDARRFGAYALNRSYVSATARESYRREYAAHLPEEELPAGRPLKTSPIYDLLKAKGAVFQSRSGWERPAWFASGGVEAIDRPSFRRANWFEPVGQECRAVREAVGVLDQTSFAKIEVVGEGAHEFLDGVLANRLPEVNRIALGLILNEEGGIECDVTVTRTSDDRYLIVASSALETRLESLLGRRLTHRTDVAIRNVTAEMGCLTVSGPRSRQLLERLTRQPVDRAAQPFFSSQALQLGNVTVHALRLSYVGELGWELYHPIATQRYLYELLLEAGEDLGIVDYGYRALESMRLEKGYLLWGEDMTPQMKPAEVEMQFLVHGDKGDFIGRDAVVEAGEAEAERKVACLVVDAEFPPHGFEPVMNSSSVVGYVTSGGYGHVVEENIALAFLESGAAAIGTELSIEMLGDSYPARVVAKPLYDPQNNRLRS